MIARVWGRLAAVTLATAQVAHAQQGQPVFRTGVDSVVVDVSVHNNKRPVGGLTVRDFEILDSGVLQSIDLVSREGLPLDVTLLVDTSASMTDRDLTQDVVLGARGYGSRTAWLVTAMKALQQDLHGLDRVAVINFASAVRDAPRSGTVLQVATPGTDEQAGRSGIMDALAMVLMLPAEPQRRHVIVLVTDARDNVSLIALRVQQAIADRSDAVVEIIAVGPPDVSLAVGGGVNGYDLLLRDLAERTGGRLFLSVSNGDFGRALTSALEEYRTGYILRFTPRGVESTGWHDLVVRVKGKSYDIVARRGYWRD